MNCPVCGYSFPEGNTCPRCRVDVALFQKVRLTAAGLYNKGLAQAREEDLSGAESSLKNSLRFDRHNCDAHNLLGLVYYRRGRMADALKHWIISSSLRPENNTTQRYIDDLQNNGRALEKANDAVRMYNLARRYLNQGNDDLAVIQLKKAVNLSPRLTEARCLLALCWLRSGDAENAATEAERVLSQDKGNPMAKHLLELAGGKAPEPEAAPAVLPGKTLANRDPQHQKRITERLRTSKRRLFALSPAELIAFCVGVAVCAVVAFSLVMPAVIERKVQSVSTLSDELNQTNTRLSELETENQRLQAENGNLTGQIADYKSQSDLAAKQSRIAQAQSYITAEDYGAAALLLLEMDTTGLSEETLAAYNAAKDACFDKGAQSLYNAGRSAYLNGDMTTAQTQFENALKLANGQDFIDDALYYIGCIAQDSGDTEKAKKYFQRVLDEYPNSNQLQNAQNQLNNL